MTFLVLVCQREEKTKKRKNYLILWHKQNQVDSIFKENFLNLTFIIVLNN